MNNFRFFKLTEISTNSAVSHFSKGNVIIEMYEYSYVVSGNDIFIMLDLEKGKDITIDIALTDLFKGVHIDDKEND